MPTKSIQINRAPVLTLWAAVVAERLGHDTDTALTLGKAVAGLNARSKGRRLGIYEDSPDKSEQSQPTRLGRKQRKLALLGRKLEAVQTPTGVRATAKGQPIRPESAQRYLERAFKDDLPAVRKAFEELAWSYTPKQLEATAYELYEQFRPEVPEGTKGWGAKGALTLASVRSLRRKKSA